MSYRSLIISPAEKAILRREFLKTPEVVPIAADPKFFSFVAALGIHQEIGTIHDELSVFLFDERTGRKIPRETLRSELIEYEGYAGVRIWAEGFDRLDPRVRGMRTLLHPELSHGKDGFIRQLVFFPEVIAKIARLEGAELVSVRPWGINTIFGGFDQSKSYYLGNMFEFINLDAIRYSRLLEKRQIVFLGTHDIVSHIAGIKNSAWPELEARGRAAREVFETYFAGISRPVPQSLILPYALGMLLDDLAQPMNYESGSRRFAVDILMEAIRSRRVDPRSSAYLLKYPPAIEKLILLARADDMEETRSKAAGVLAELLSEIQAHSILSPSISSTRNQTPNLTWS